MPLLSLPEELGGKLLLRSKIIILDKLGKILNAVYL
jgi:hypothetical protein